MSNRGAAVLGVRLLGLYLAVQAMLALAGLLREGFTRNALLTEVALPLALALLLWVAVGALANHILPPRRGDSAQTPPPLDVNAAHAIAFAAVGLLVLAESLPVFLTALWANGHPLPVAESIVAVEGLRSLLGLLLLLGARDAAGMVARLSGVDRR